MSSTYADSPAYRSLTHPASTRAIEVIDQRALPGALVRVTIADAESVASAIRDMLVRGAPLIGAVGAYGLALALDRDADDVALDQAHAMLDATRPTAINLRWALDRVRTAVRSLPIPARADAAWREADAIASEDVAINHAIGVHGLALLRELGAGRLRVFNAMTHCNAGALASCGWGTATAPLFLARTEGLAIHVWVSETRPRMQGAMLTAWELRERGIPHTLFVDSASGLLMRRGEVNAVLVGADRVAANGDVCNKIGTYDKALAAKDNGLPFYVALPSPTIDWTLASGDSIPIESRSTDEVLRVTGREPEGRDADAIEGTGRETGWRESGRNVAGANAVAVAIAPARTRAVNYAFDVTPARLVTGYVTERGIARNARELAAMHPERAGARRH